MYYVYLIKSTTHPDQTYIGITSDLKARLKAHNEGRSPHTAKYKPWMLITYLAFSDKSKAADFEQYLKSGSGHAFANKSSGKCMNSRTNLH
jgi:predicted GIY-YIG superfamily endonuclease